MDVEVIRERLYSAINSIGSEKSLEMLAELGSKIPEYLRLHLAQDHTIPSPSRLMDCRYQLWCHSKKYDPDQDVPVAWKIRQAAGILQEVYWVHIFSLAGFDIELPAKTYECGPHMQAHPDALLGTNDALELKSTTGIGFKKLTDSYGVSTEYYNHYMQAQLYLFAADKERCLYFATTPDPGLLQSTLRQKKRYGPTFELEPIYLEWLERDESTIKEGLERAELIASDAKSDEPAPKEFSGQTHSRLGKRIMPCGYCLGRGSQVITDRGLIPIERIVKHHIQANVLSVEPNGSLTWQPITGWLRNPRNERQMFRVTKQHGRRDRLGATFTDDHRVLTRRGWVRVDALTSSDEVATGEEAPNSKMQELIDGTMLGDASIGAKQKTFTFQQTDISYARLKQWALGTLKPNSYLNPRYNHSQGWNARPCLCISFPIRVWSKQQRKRWYEGTVKRIPYDLKLTDLTLAAWYLDDGCLEKRQKKSHRPFVSFNTQCFTYKERKQLSNLLLQKGIDNHPTDRNNGTIYVGADGTEQLMKCIGHFIPPDMRRKATPDAPTFDISAWKLGSAITGWDHVTVEPVSYQVKGTRGNTKGKLYEGKTVYCLEVEGTHNFVTVSGVVHNCPFAERCNEQFGYGVGLEWER